MSDQEKATYANAVWDAFCEVTRRPRLMGPVEFSLVRFWMSEGVPLRLVLGAIRETKPGWSLCYYEKPVEAAVRRSMGGM